MWSTVQFSTISFPEKNNLEKQTFSTTTTGCFCELITSCICLLSICRWRDPSATPKGSLTWRKRTWISWPWGETAVQSRRTCASPNQSASPRHDCPLCVQGGLVQRQQPEVRGRVPGGRPGSSACAESGRSARRVVRTAAAWVNLSDLSLFLLLVWTWSIYVSMSLKETNIMLLELLRWKTVIIWT